MRFESIDLLAWNGQCIRVGATEWRWYRDNYRQITWRALRNRTLRFWPFIIRSHARTKILVGISSLCVTLIRVYMLHVIRVVWKYIASYIEPAATSSPGNNLDIQAANTRCGNKVRWKMLWENKHHLINNI